MALIELHQVWRQYRLGQIEVTALAGVDLAIEAGEFVAIMGQSGSGKSTLMNVLGCLDPPTGGQVVIDGQDVAHLGPDALAALRREHFGFIFQRYHLLPHLDALGNAALPAVYAGIGSRVRLSRARDLLQRLGLGDRLHHKPNQMSGGQQQRVSIARALMNGGQIVLADEPTGALDSTSGAALLELLRELNERGHTVIVVTHDASVAAHARRVIELRDGRLVRDDGTPAQHAPPVALHAAPTRPPESRLRSLQVKWREALATAALSLRSNRLRSALSMLGISIGIASVVSIVALTQAARGTLEGELSSQFVGRITLFAGSSELAPGVPAPPFTSNQVNAMAGLPGVAGLLRERQTAVSARFGRRELNSQAQAAGATLLRDNQLRIREGRDFAPFELSEGTRVALLDRATATQLFGELQSPIGRMVLLTAQASAAGPVLSSETPGTSSPAAPATAATAAPAALLFRVVGVVEGTSQVGFDFSKNLLYVPERSYRASFDAGDEVQTFSVILDKGQDPQQLLALVKHRLRALRGREDFTSWAGDQAFQKFRTFSAGFAALLAGVAAIALLVGGVGVMNIMLVSVSERTREIGIRMAVGARQADVRREFLIEAVMLCCLGGLAGVGLSWFGSLVANAAQQMLHLRVDWTALGVAFFVSSVVGLMFGTLPARQAAALSPVDALARE
jgi:macrolide transport system ATP-binding/permease protein